jgi:hypothetical protein
MSHLSHLPRTIDQIDMAKYGCDDDWKNDMIKDGIISVIKASNELGIDMWAYMSEYSPPANQGFMYSDDAKIRIIGQKMETGHSGTSYGWIMRYLEHLAKNGPFIKERQIRTWLSTEINEIKTCAICQDTTQTHVITPCNHNYCKDCINNWLKQSSACPYCRTNI